MTDHVSQEDRSRIMKEVRSKNTSTELAVRKLIYSLGYRYRLHYKELPGKPDLTFIGRKKAIFIHGCFWHAHECPKGRPPKSNLAYWLPKLERNKARDIENINSLSSLGWKTLTIWQCEIKNEESLRKKILHFLES